MYTDSILPFSQNVIKIFATTLHYLPSLYIIVIYKQERMSALAFSLSYRKLQKIIRALSTLTGISMAFLDAQHNYLCKSVQNDHFCSAIQEMNSSGKGGQTERF